MKDRVDFYPPLPAPEIMSDLANLMAEARAALDAALYPGLFEDQVEEAVKTIASSLTSEGGIFRVFMEAGMLHSTMIPPKEFYRPPEDDPDAPKEPSE